MIGILGRRDPGQSERAVMIQKTKLEALELEKIIVDPNGPFTMSYCFSIGKLLQSIKEVGLINPPILYATPNNRFNIVCGLRRIIACEILGIDRIPAILVENASNLQLLLINFYDNLTVRNFNLIEQAMMIERLSIFFDEHELSKFLVLFNMKPAKETIDFCRWLTSLPDYFKIHVARGEFSIKYLNLLKDLSPADFDFVVDLSIRLSLSKSYSEELVSVVRDISVTRDMPFSQLSIASRFYEIIDSDKQVSQKTKEVMELLREYRNPRYSLAKESFLRLKKRIEFVDYINLETNPYFEEDYYTLKLKFKDGEELKERLDSLLDIVQKETIPEIARICLDAFEKVD